MTIREALEKKREQHKGNVAELVLCKGELFYCLKDGDGRMGSGPDDTVYPVGPKIVEKEAAFFGCVWSEQ
jgi:hypothetical protein